MPQSAELYDLKNVLTTDWQTFFVDNRDGKFLLPCEEGTVELSGARCLLNIMLTLPLIKRGHPISRDRHMLLSGIYNSKEHAKRLTEVSRDLQKYGYTLESLGHDMIGAANMALNLCSTHLGEHIKTMDIFGLAETILQPEAKDTCTIKYGDVNDKQIQRMEKAFQDQSDEMYKLLSGNTLPYNILQAPLQCGALKSGQFYQFVLSAGPRTDTDEDIFKRPVVGSFLSGMHDILDLAIESRSAAKANHYNNTQMDKAQYTNRKIHLQNSILRYLYLGDCGSQVYMTYEPVDATVRLYHGKYFLTPGGELVELTTSRYKEVIGKSVQFRDPITCRYTDGYCETCGGTITKTFPRNGNVGFLANVNAGAPATQQVLSTKHHVNTDAEEYRVPEPLKPLLHSLGNNIFIRPSLQVRAKTMALGFKPNNIAQLNDLQYYIPTTGGNAAYFTELTYLSVGEIQEDGQVRQEISRTAMAGEGKAYPYLSPEVLTVIRQHPEDIVIQGNIAWLLLRNVDLSKPIMQCTVVNKSIKRFVDEFGALVTRGIEKYTSANDFMRVFTKLLWDKVPTHITHVAVMARAAMLTSRKDFRIPMVTNPDNVMFGTLGKIIPMRSPGALFAFQGIHIAFNRPITFIAPKDHGVFDEFMGSADLIERDIEWPLVTGSPVELDLK